jgi:8-amino-7-oxononanoate synthase
VVVTGAAPGWVELAGRSVVNFASANHLGLEVGRWLGEGGVAAMEPWGLSIGLPSSVASDAPTEELQQELAALVCAEAARVGPSTLHLLLDAVTTLAGAGGTVALPRRAYTLSETVAQRARGAGCAVIRFEPDRVDRLAVGLRSARRPLVILATSVEYPGVIVPLRPLLDLACAARGFLVVDDTPAMGLLGRPAPGHPHGIGGGGGVLWNGLRPEGSLIQVAGLCKAFSVPLAFVSGSRRVLDRICRGGGVLAASSPADLVSIQTARWALQANARSGEALRVALAGTVTLLRTAGGLTGADAGLPVLSLYYPDRPQAEAAGNRLLQLGVWGLLDPRPRGRPPGQAALRFNVSAAHAGPLAARALVAFRHLNRSSVALRAA